METERSESYRQKMALCEMLASSKGIVIFFNFLFTVLGSLLILLGFCVILDDFNPHVLHLLTPPGGSRFVIICITYILFFVGCGLIILASFGCCALLSRPCLIVTYLCVIVTLELVELVVVLATLSYRSSMLVGLQSRLTVKLISGYGHKNSDNVNMYGDNVFTQSLDHTQYTFNCCGVTGAHEYNLSRYFNDSQLSNEPRNVPITCCNRTISKENNAGSPLSVVSRVFHGTVEEDWQNPYMQHEDDCQSNKPGAQYTQGCLEKIQDWLLSQSNWLVTVLLVPLLFQLVCTGFFIDRLRKKNEPKGQVSNLAQANEVLQARG